MNSLATLPIKILLADPLELTRIGLKYAFHHERDTFDIVGEAHDPATTLSCVERHQPDVVLIDIELPQMEGIATTRAIKDQFPQVRIIALTFAQTPEVVLTALQAGVDGYCLKDISSERLLQVLKLVAEGVLWLDPPIARLLLSLVSRESLEKKPFGARPRQRYVCDLSGREQEVLKLIVLGRSNKQIAQSLVITLSTAKAHVCNIIQKLGVNDRTQAAVKALTEGLIQSDPPACHEPSLQTRPLSLMNAFRD